jgi:hypothetical protein
VKIRRDPQCEPRGRRHPGNEASVEHLKTPKGRCTRVLPQRPNRQDLYGVFFLTILYTECYIERARINERLLMCAKLTLVLMIVFWALTGAESGAQNKERFAPTSYDNSPCHRQFVTVEPDLKLENLDWGGGGGALILLAGLGFDAHAFDSFAPKLVSAYHVHLITGRGCGDSSFPKPITRPIGLGTMF